MNKPIKPMFDPSSRRSPIDEPTEKEILLEIYSAITTIKNIIVFGFVVSILGGIIMAMSIAQASGD